MAESRGRALYERIADELRQEIADGRLRPGAKLPTEAEISRKWATSRGTAVNGLRVLVHEGLVIPDRPRGYFVREHRPMVYRPQREFRRTAPDLDIFRQRVADEGDGREADQTIEVAIATPPDHVRERLGIGPDDEVAVRRRTRTIGGEPYNIQDSHVPLKLVQGTEWMSSRDVPRGTNQVLSELGHEIVQALDEISIRMPNPDEVRRLSIAPGTPVAEHIATGYSEDGRVVQVTINILLGDRHVIIYERFKNRNHQNTETP